jgi:adenylate cyclase
MEAVNYFRGGLDYYRQREWDKAIRTFQEAAEINPQDKLPPLYIERCEYLKLNPPAADWSGVWVMKTK